MGEGRDSGGIEGMEDEEDGEGDEAELNEEESKYHTKVCEDLRSKVITL